MNSTTVVVFMVMVMMMIMVMRFDNDNDNDDDDDDDDNHHKSDQHQISPCHADALSEWSRELWTLITQDEFTFPTISTGNQ